MSLRPRGGEVGEGLGLGFRDAGVRVSGAVPSPPKAAVVHRNPTEVATSNHKNDNTIHSSHNTDDHQDG